MSSGERVLNRSGDHLWRTPVHLSLVTAMRSGPEHLCVLAASSGRKVGDYVLDVSQSLVHGGSGNGSGLDGAHPDSEGMQFQTQIVGENSKSSLTGIQQSAKRDRNMSAHRADVYDAPAIVAQPGQQRLD